MQAGGRDKLKKPVLDYHSVLLGGHRKVSSVDMKCKCISILNS